LQGTCVGSLESVEMLFKFIAPLVQEGEDDDNMDEEVRPCSNAKRRNQLAINRSANSRKVSLEQQRAVC
jgi:hypothetical protein